MSSTSAATRLACLLGHPVAHSLSPQIHNAAFAAAGFDAVYLAFDVAADTFEAAVRGLAALDALGANVTVPHKRLALAIADECTGEARAIGAANMLSFRDGRVLADNTDAAGLAHVLLHDVGLEAGEQVLLFGAGGAARAAAVALGRIGAAVVVAARRPDAADDVAALAAASGAVSARNGSLSDTTTVRLVVNATPLGLHGEPLPDPLHRLHPGQTALDLVYGRRPTPFLEAAAEAGAAGLDGLGMLVAQAGESFTRWTGRPAPLEVMAAAARSATR